MFIIGFSLFIYNDRQEKNRVLRGLSERELSITEDVNGGTFGILKYL